MKKFISIIIAVTAVTSVTAQQIPITESYFLDKYSFATAYAGNFNSKFLFLGYRSDWSGIDGGPKTFRLSFNNSFMKNAGYGVKMIYDRAGIFDQLYVLASYSYRVNVSEEHNLLFGISAGIYRNTLNISDYYNDPNYNLDPALISQNVKSKLKFMSDASVVWKWNTLEAGFMFTNISFGDAAYDEVDVTYKPLANFQIHALKDFSISEKFNLIPVVIIRGGKYIKSQFEVASQLVYQQKVWLGIVYRDPQVIGAGLGASIGSSLKLSYNFNFASGVAMNVFNNHEISLGVNLFDIAGKK